MFFPNLCSIVLFLGVFPSSEWLVKLSSLLWEIPGHFQASKNTRLHQAVLSSSYTSEICQESLKTALYVWISSLDSCKMAIPLSCHWLGNKLGDKIHKWRLWNDLELYQAQGSWWGHPIFDQTGFRRPFSLPWNFRPDEHLQLSDFLWLKLAVFKHLLIHTFLVESLVVI